MPGVLNDEPAESDKLDRSKLAIALASVIEGCDTPLVIGLYGTWGLGKTTLMRMTERRLASHGKVISVWFDAWQHQFDENPSVALLHTMVDELALGDEGKKLLSVISGAFGSLLLRATTSLSTPEIRELGERYEEERFQTREKQIRLRANFIRLLAKATDGGRVRLAFFIDDLDRCVPEQVLKVLEALKLFLNMPGCVYVLGVDRAALETSIRHRYQQLQVSEIDYLDKIVQLPFVVPPIADESLGKFITSLLPEPLQSVANDLVIGLGENPRRIKRFVNVLLLNHELAHGILGSAYDVRALAAVLLLQYRKPDLYKQLVRDPEAVKTWSKSKGTEGDLADPSVELVVQRFKAKPIGDLARYVFLSEVASVRKITFDLVLTNAGTNKIQTIKAIRMLTEWGLKEAKEASEKLPSVLKSGLSREEAEQAASSFVEVGATVELR